MLIIWSRVVIIPFFISRAAKINWTDMTIVCSGNSYLSNLLCSMHYFLTKRVNKKFSLQSELTKNKTVRLLSRTTTGSLLHSRPKTRPRPDSRFQSPEIFTGKTNLLTKWQKGGFFRPKCVSLVVLLDHQPPLAQSSPPIFPFSFSLPLFSLRWFWWQKQGRRYFIRSNHVFPQFGETGASKVFSTWELSGTTSFESRWFILKASSSWHNSSTS